MLDETTAAWLGTLSNITASNGAVAGTPNISVTASDNTLIVSVAGSLSGAGTAAIGVGADVATITKRTLAFVDSGSTVTAEGNFVVTADSLEDLTSVAAGAAGAGSASVVADAGVHVLDITTRAWIGDDPRDAIATSGPGSYTATGSMNVAADDRTEIDKVVGVAAGAAYAGVGAAAGVSTSTKLTEAFIGSGAVVNAYGQGAPLTVRTGEFGLSTIGASPNTPGIEPGSVSITSSPSSLSASGEVGLPKVGNMDVDRQAGNDATDPSITSQRVVTPITRALNGLAVTATNRDDIEVYTVSIAGGLGAIALSAGVNIVDNQTLATIGSGAQVNQTRPNASAAQSVLVAAGHDINQTAFGGTLAVGGAVSPTVGVTVIKETTNAEIGNLANVRASDDTIVQAYGTEDVLLVGTGIAGGFALGASVGVLTIDNHMTARIADQARVYAGGDVAVLVNDSSDIDLISGAVAVGSAGIGAAVGVLNIDKVTTAVIDNSAIVDALGNGTGIANTLTGDKNAGGTDYVRATISGVIVQATSSESFTHFAVAAGVGAAVGVAGGVAVSMIDSDTVARIGASAQINKNLLGAAPATAQSIYVNAANSLGGLSFAGALGVGAVGIAGAVDVAILRNDTLADVASGANLYAKNDVEVSSLSIESLKGYAIGGAAGTVGLAASVSVWSIGTQLDKNYSNDNRSGQGTPQSANALEGQGGQRADSDAARQAQGGSSQSSSYLNGFDDDTSNPNQSSNKRVGQITAAAASRVSSRAPTQASLQAEIDAGGTASGTTARISGGAIVRADDAINVTSDAGLQFTQLAGAVAVGVVGIGAGVGISTIANNSTAQAGGTLSSGAGGISVRSRNNENNGGTGFAGAAGFVGLGASVVVINDASVAQSAISDNAKVDTTGSVTVSTNDVRSITTDTGSVAVGAIAAGATFSRVNLRNDSARETQAVVGNNVTLNAANLTIESLPTHTVAARTVGVAGGAIAATVNFAFVDAAPESYATIGSGNITVLNELNITSSMTDNFRAKGTGVVVALGAAGMMYSDVDAGAGDNVDEVVAGIVGAANVKARVMMVQSKSTDTLLADSTSGAGGGIVIAGSIARTSSDMSTLITVAGGATINASTLSLYNSHTHDIDSVSDSITIAAGSGKAALADNTNKGKANIDIGAATITANKIDFKANNDLTKNKPDTNKPVPDQYRSNVNSQTAAGISVDVLSSDTDIGTASVPFQSKVNFAPGAKVTALGSVTDPGTFEVAA